MRSVARICAFLLLVACGASEVPADPPRVPVHVGVQEGDLIFHTSGSRQSKAIQLATGSTYSHMGIILAHAGELQVLEAIQPVTFTPLRQWIARGEQRHYVVKRLKAADRDLTTEALARMKEEGDGLLGKDYDAHFGWSDERMYCSELVWKLYQRSTGVELGALQRLGDFDLSHATVQQKLKERYGSDVPMDERVISPKAMFDSKELITVEIP